MRSLLLEKPHVVAEFSKGGDLTGDPAGGKEKKVVLNDGGLEFIKQRIQEWGRNYDAVKPLLC